MVDGYAIRSARDLLRAFEGVRTVLRPGGRLVLLGIVRGSRCVRDLTRHFWDSISFIESPETVLLHLEEAEFTDVDHRPAGGLLGGFRATAPTD